MTTGYTRVDVVSHMRDFAYKKRLIELKSKFEEIEKLNDEKFCLRDLKRIIKRVTKEETLNDLKNLIMYYEFMISKEIQRVNYKNDWLNKFFVAIDKL